MGKLTIDPNILRWWEETKKMPLPEKLDDAALEFEMMLEAHEETLDGPAETLCGASRAHNRKREM